jgi:hypothetical protein
MSSRSRMRTALQSFERRGGRGICFLFVFSTGNSRCLAVVGMTLTLFQQPAERQRRQDREYVITGTRHFACCLKLPTGLYPLDQRSNSGSRVKLPRDLSGSVVVKALERRGFTATRKPTPSSTPNLSEVARSFASQKLRGFSWLPKKAADCEEPGWLKSRFGSRPVKGTGP